MRVTIPVGAVAAGLLLALAPLWISAAQAQDSANIAAENVVGCRGLRTVYELAGLADAKDMPALKRAFTDALAAGECIAFARGERVSVIETKPQSKLLRVRRSAGAEEYWLGYPAVGR
jgi:hypothetical protein